MYSFLSVRVTVWATVEAVARCLHMVGRSELERVGAAPATPFRYPDFKYALDMFSVSVLMI